MLGVHWKDWCWSWNSNTLATWCEELTHWKRFWCWEGLGAGGQGDKTGWDGWMALSTQWTGVWVNSRSWWWTGRPGVLRFMGSQRVGHDWATKLNWTEPKWHCIFKSKSTSLLLINRKEVALYPETCLSKGCILGHSSHSRKCWQNIYSKDREGVEESLIIWVQLASQLAFMFSEWPPLTLLTTTIGDSSVSRSKVLKVTIRKTKFCHCFHTFLHFLSPSCHINKIYVEVHTWTQWTIFNYNKRFSKLWRLNSCTRLG